MTIRQKVTAPRGPRNGGTSPYGIGAELATEKRRRDDLRVPDRRLNALLAFVHSSDRICPEPGAWMRLHRLLGNGAPTPLILAGWDSPWWAKRRRLEAQIRFAAEHGRLERVHRFLRRLSPPEWYVEGEAERRLDPEPLIYRLLDEPGRGAPVRGRQLSFTFR